MTLLDRLRALVDALPPGGSVTFTREWLAGELQGAAAAPQNVDLTIAQVAARLGRAPSTVRGWLERGELNGYRFRGREWRIAPAALEAFVARERGTADRRSARPSISDWRALRKDATMGPIKTRGEQ
jgi:excisionase family DNA binding protein